jgi:hypothetical protein
MAVGGPRQFQSSQSALISFENEDVLETFGFPNKCFWCWLARLEWLPCNNNIMRINGIAVEIKPLSNRALHIRACRERT